MQNTNICFYSLANANNTVLKPQEESTEAVLDWLNSSGISALDIEDAGEWVNFNATVRKAQALLNTTFAVYNLIGTDVETIRTLR